MRTTLGTSVFEARHELLLPWDELYMLVQDVVRQELART